MTEYKTLSVGDLIKELQAFPPDAPVWTVHDLHYGPVLSELSMAKNDNGCAPVGAVCIQSLWLAPDEYTDLEWIDHRGKRHTIKAYQSE